MSFDWQTIAVALIVLAALAYVLRGAWARLRSMRAGAPAVGVPACGNCPGGESKPSAPRPRVIVQIGRSRPPRG
jgi:hypothetical protein